MRLDETTRNKLIRYTRQQFGDDSKLYLFGSRVDDTKKGGDIDLYLNLPRPLKPNEKNRFLAGLYRHVTQRSIDLVVKTPSSRTKSIYDTAEQEGIRLC